MNGPQPDRADCPEQSPQSRPERPSVDWQEEDRLDAFGVFGGRIVPYNGNWKIYLRETNSELWAFPAKAEAEAKFAEAIKKSGYCDEENPLLRAVPRPELGDSKDALRWKASKSLPIR